MTRRNIPRAAAAMLGLPPLATRVWGQARSGARVRPGDAGWPSDAARDTATNPAVLDAFALAISAAHGPPAWPGIAGHEPDVATARTRAAAITNAPVLGYGSARGPRLGFLSQ